MTTEPNKNNRDSDARWWSRIAELERDQAATTTDIRGIYAGMEEIRDVLVRIQESAKPNIGMLFIALLATCTFFVTIGGLALAPIYRDMARFDTQIMEFQNTQNTIQQSRFTRANGEDLEVRLHTELLAHMQESRAIAMQTRERTARLEGMKELEMQQMLRRSE